MGRLTTLRPRATSAQSRLRNSTTKDRRITGSKLQNIRFKMWKENPYCAICGKLTQYPYGFQIDHKIPLEQGGSESQENRQLLCTTVDEVEGCHEKKTREESKLR